MLLYKYLFYTSGGDVMNMDKTQERVLYSKPGYYIVKGKKNTGKSTLAIWKAVYIENNYCLYKDEKVLMVFNTEEEVEEAKLNYKSINLENKSQFHSFFSTEESKITFTTVDNLVNKILNHNRLHLEKKFNIEGFKVLDNNEDEIFSQVFKKFKYENPKSKILKEKYIAFFLQEINWIRSCNFKSFNEYGDAQRFCRKYEKGASPSALGKNSTARELIYRLKKFYEIELFNRKLIHKLQVISLLASIVNKQYTYTHIIVDNGEGFRKVELDLIITLFKPCNYSNFIFFNGKESNNLSMGWLIRSRKLDSLGYIGKRKSFNLKKLYEIINHEKYIDNNYNDYMEIYDYCDLRHNRNCRILRDISNFDELILKNHGEEEIVSDLQLIPVYNDIAAGEPIMINDEFEGNFYLPRYFFRGIKDVFILKVKGDSMINANINNGDLVLLRKQSNAENNDIVAVDLYGSATLKRLNISSKGIYLMPENINYEPIKVTEEGASIMGVAIGILKNKG